MQPDKMLHGHGSLQRGRTAFALGADPTSAYVPTGPAIPARYKETVADVKRNDHRTGMTRAVWRRSTMC